MTVEEKRIIEIRRQIRSLELSMLPGLAETNIPLLKAEIARLEAVQ